LFVPLLFEGQLDGLLVLGGRAAGDVYSEQDLHIIATVARQAALAYANVQLVEALRGLHRRLVQADEAQRKRVARELHDTALQQLFFVRHNLLRDQRHADLVPLLDDTIGTLRQTVKAQRPPLLDQGLRLALQSLVEETQALTGGSPAIHWRGDTTDRPPLSDEQATALYRIAQESLANALKHAQAQNVSVTLDAGADGAVRLCIEDDGVGMPVSASGSRAEEQRYGLLGMQERAAMINTQLDVVSKPKEGTKVTVTVEV
jgi:signal transduction histidine kinase